MTQSASNHLRVAVIGLGFIAEEAHMRVLLGRRDVTVAGIHDRDPVTLDKYPTLPGFTDLDEMIETIRPDAAYVLTPATTHEAIIRRLLEARIAIFCEKPLAADLDSATRLIECAEAQAGRLFVGFNRRYAPAMTTAKQWLGDRRPSMGVFQKHRPVQDHRPSLENLIHMVDLTRFYFGECVGVQAHAQHEDPFRERGLVTTLTFEDGALAVVAATYGECGQWSERVELYGFGHSIMIDAPNSVSIIDHALEHAARQNPLSGGLDSSMINFGFQAETEHFLSFVRSSQTAHPSGADALRTQALMSEIFVAAGLPVAEPSPRVDPALEGS